MASQTSDSNTTDEVEVETPQPSQPVSLMDVNLLTDYLIKVCPLLMDAEQHKELFAKTLKSSECTTTLSKFISDGKTPGLVVQKTLTKGNVVVVVVILNCGVSYEYWTQKTLFCYMRRHSWM